MPYLKYIATPKTNNIIKEVQEMRRNLTRGLLRKDALEVV